MRFTGHFLGKITKGYCVDVKFNPMISGVVVGFPSDDLVTTKWFLRGLSTQKLIVAMIFEIITDLLPNA